MRGVNLAGVSSVIGCAGCWFGGVGSRFIQPLPSAVMPSRVWSVWANPAAARLVFGELFGVFPVLVNHTLAAVPLTCLGRRSWLACCLRRRGGCFSCISWVSVVGPASRQSVRRPVFVAIGHVILVVCASRLCRLPRTCGPVTVGLSVDGIADAYCRRGLIATSGAVVSMWAEGSVRRECAG